MNILLLFPTISAFLISLLFITKNSFIKKLIIGLLIILQASFSLFIYKNSGKSFLANYLYVDNLAVLLTIVSTIICLNSLINSYFYLKNTNSNLRHQRIYLSTLFLLFWVLQFSYLINNAILLWVFVETTTLLLAVLIYHERNLISLEATWKYVFISTIGLSLSLIGIIIMNLGLSDTGNNLFFFNNIVHNYVIKNSLILQISFLLIIIGYSVKMEIFPLHTVCIDANSVGPTPISAILSTLVANLGFVNIFKFYKILYSTELQNWASNTLMILGVISVLFAAIYIIRVRYYKRMAAYSSIEHMGFIAIAVALSNITWFAAAIHLVVHSFVKSSLFLEYSNILMTYRSKKITKISNYIQINPIGSLSIIIATILILGIPPSPIFFSEIMVFKQMFINNKIWLALILMFFMTIIIWAMLYNNLRILFHKNKNFEQQNISKIPVIASIPQFITLIFVLYFSIFSSNYLIEILKNLLK